MVKLESSINHYLACVKNKVLALMIVKHSASFCTSQPCAFVFYFS